MTSSMDIRDFQNLVDKMYSDRDRARGSAATFLWLIEEIGELASALADGTTEEKATEFADVLAWLATLANIEEIDLADALRRKYAGGCPGCGEMTCVCNEKP